MYCHYCNQSSGVSRPLSCLRGFSPFSSLGHYNQLSFFMPTSFLLSSSYCRVVVVSYPCPCPLLVLRMLPHCAEQPTTSLDEPNALSSDCILCPRLKDDVFLDFCPLSTGDDLPSTINSLSTGNSLSIGNCLPSSKLSSSTMVVAWEYILCWFTTAVAYASATMAFYCGCIIVVVITSVIIFAAVVIIVVVVLTSFCHRYIAIKPVLWCQCCNSITIVACLPSCRL